MDWERFYEVGVAEDCIISYNACKSPQEWNQKCDQRFEVFKQELLLEVKGLRAHQKDQIRQSLSAELQNRLKVLPLTRQLNTTFKFVPSAENSSNNDSQIESLRPNLDTNEFDVITSQQLERLRNYISDEAFNKNKSETVNNRKGFVNIKFEPRFVRELYNELSDSGFLQCSYTTFALYFKRSNSNWGILKSNPRLNWNGTKADFAIFIKCIGTEGRKNEIVDMVFDPVDGHLPSYFMNGTHGKPTSKMLSIVGAYKTNSKMKS